MERGEQLLKAYADASALQPEALTAFLKDIGAAETSAKHKIPFAVAKRLGVERAKLFKLLKKMKSGENK